MEQWLYRRTQHRTPATTTKDIKNEQQ